MATKKAASTAKKSTQKKSTSAKKQSTNVTTVKAVESTPVTSQATSKRGLSRFGLNRTPLIAALLAEFVGTFIFAATIIAGQGQPILVFFALVGVVLAVGTISGAYVNPALVIGGWITRRMKGFRAFMYIIAQVLGAMLALVVLNMYVNAAPATSSTDLYSGAIELFKAAPLPEGKEWLMFLAEFIGTLVFGFAVAGATREKKERTAAAFTVGLGVFLGLMIAGSAAAYLGGSSILNPAVAVSLQALSFDLWPIMVYVVGSTLGAIIGFVLFDMLRGKERETA
jgi:aquaporin Z